MADCFTLPNAAEMVEELEHLLSLNDDNLAALVLKNNDVQNAIIKASDAIEQFAKDIDVLTKENSKLKEERDAYVRLFSKTDVWKCLFCAHNRQPHRMAFADCDVAGECKNTDALPTHFELRGVKAVGLEVVKEEEDG